MLNTLALNFIGRLSRKIIFLVPRAILVGIFLFTLVVTVLSNFDYLETRLAPVYMARASVRPLSASTLIGPYPHLDEMYLLKKQGVTVLISLLDTSLPQEKALYEREKINAAKIGLELRHYPLGYLPVNSAKNRNMREQLIRELEGVSGKAYLHCYLGRHRVQFVADELKALGEKGKLKRR